MGALPEQDPRTVISEPAVIVPLREYQQLKLAEQIADPERWLDALEEADLIDDRVYDRYLRMKGSGLQEMRQYHAAGRPGAVSGQEARRILSGEGQRRPAALRAR